MHVLIIICTESGYEGVNAHFGAVYSSEWPCEITNPTGGPLSIFNSVSSKSAKGSSETPASPSVGVEVLTKLPESNSNSRPSTP